MNDTRMNISLGNRDFYLVGTAHVSKESINEVSAIIREEKPDIVCVELDEGRYASITRKDNWENLNMVKVFREGKGFLLMANLVLSGFQRRMGAELGVKPGEEMKTALDTAKELDIPHALCDREIQTTLRRAWANCGLWNKCKLLASLLSSAFTTEKLKPEEIEDLKKRNELDGMMNELASYLPKVKETLINERDQYLAAKIWKAAIDLPPPEPKAPVVLNPVVSDFGSMEYMAPVVIPAPPAVQKIIAVVGAGHMKGIRNHLEKLSAGEQSSDVAALDVIPPPGPLSKAAGWIFPALIVALVAAGFFVKGTDKGFDMILRWVLWNGSLAALGAIVALGHPLSVLVSFLGAPFATLNPFIGVGLLSGLAQAMLRKPRVLDAQNIADDVGSLKGIYRNRISRALLVFFLSSIGGVIGNIVSIPAIFSTLFGK
jgi:pheromone shutdown protein TraB